MRDDKTMKTTLRLSALVIRGGKLVILAFQALEFSVTLY